MDAALLLIPRTGFLDWDDPRVVGTIEAVRRELARDGLLLRYDPEADPGLDNLPGTEGAFLVCSFWLVEALASIGRKDESQELFEELPGLTNDLGLLSEQYDTSAGHQIGNFRQAYSHVGLVNTARHLDGL